MISELRNVIREMPRIRAELLDNRSSVQTRSELRSFFSAKKTLTVFQAPSFTLRRLRKQYQPFPSRISAASRPFKACGSASEWGKS